MQQRKCLNQGPTPSHDVVNSSSGTQAVELLTPMDGDPARPMLAGCMDEEEAYHGINTGHFSGVQEKNADSANASADRMPLSNGSATEFGGPGLNLSSGNKSNTSSAKKKQVRTRAQTRKPVNSKPKKD